MARYKTSKISKNNILEACRELFYLQGYTKTTYVDICNKANSNPGLINYYFKTKRNIASEIFSDFFKGLKDAVTEYINNTCDHYDLQVGTTLEIRILTYLLEHDENFARFYYDTSMEGLEYESDTIYHFYKLHVEEYNLPFDDEEVKLIQTSIVGAGIGITKRMLEGYFNCDSKTIFNFRIRSMFNVMGVSNERVAEVLNTTEEIFKDMAFELKDYFKLEIKN